MTAEKEEASTSTASIGHDEIGAAATETSQRTMSLACVDANVLGARMGGEIIEKVLAGFACEFSGLGLTILEPGG